MNAITESWSTMTEQLESKNPDDFLKVFWTSRFGRVQKNLLFNLIKNEFNGPEGVRILVSRIRENL